MFLLFTVFNNLLLTSEIFDLIDAPPGQNNVFLYRTVESFLSNEAPERKWHIPTSDIKQLDAGECSFSLLTADGEVFTWGDARYGLGREVNLENPADDPCIVSALEGLQINHISCGGWFIAALSKDQDLYILGSNSGKQRIQFTPNLPEDVELVDLGEGVDVVDVAVGGGHICVLSKHGDVYTAGRNENGQAGRMDTPFQETWGKWERTWKGTAVSVSSGMLSTFCCVSTS